MFSNNVYQNYQDQGSHQGNADQEGLEHQLEQLEGKSKEIASQFHQQHGSSEGTNRPDDLSVADRPSPGAMPAALDSTKIIAHPRPQAPQGPPGDGFPPGSGPPLSANSATLNSQSEGVSSPPNSHFTGLPIQHPANAQAPMDARMQWHMLQAAKLAPRIRPPQPPQRPPVSNVVPSSRVANIDVGTMRQLRNISLQEEHSNSSSKPEGPPNLAPAMAYLDNTRDSSPSPDPGEREPSSS